MSTRPEIAPSEVTTSPLIYILNETINLSQNLPSFELPEPVEYCRIPNSIMVMFFNGFLTQLEFSLYILFFNSETGKFKCSFPSLEQLRMMFHTDKTRISEAIKTLEELNLISVKRVGESHIKNEYNTKIPLNNKNFRMINLILKADRNYQNYKENKNLGVSYKRPKIKKIVKVKQELDLKNIPKHANTPGVFEKKDTYKSTSPKNYIENQEVSMGLILKSDLNSKYPYIIDQYKISSSSSKKKEKAASVALQPLLPSCPPFGGRAGEEDMKSNTLVNDQNQGQNQESNPLATKLRLKTSSIPPELNADASQETLNSKKGTQTTPEQEKGLKSKNRSSVIYDNCPKELLPFLMYWVNNIKPINPKTKLYKLSVLFLRQLVKGTLYNTCKDRDPYQNSFFTPYHNRPITLDDFKKAVDNFKIQCTDEAVLPRDKTKIKKLNLDMFLLSTIPGVKAGSHFIKSHSWVNPNDHECLNPILQNELAGVYVNTIKQEPQYPLNIEEFALFGDAADKLMKFVYSLPNKIIQDLYPRQYAYMLYYALLHDGMTDKTIGVKTFLSDATYFRRLKVYLESPEGVKYTYQTRSMEEIATEIRESREQTLEEKIEEWEKGDIINLTEEGYEIYGADIYDPVREINVGYVCEDGSYYYFPSSDEVELAGM